MDLQRSESRFSQWLWGILICIALLVAFVAIRQGLRSLLPTTPTIDSRTIVFDTVRRGEFVHQIRCAGQFISLKQVERSARMAATVEQIFQLPGVEVSKDTLIVKLINPDLERSRIDAHSKLTESKASLRTEAARIANELMRLESEASKLKYEHEVAEARYQVGQDLWQKNAFSKQELKYLQINATGTQAQLSLAERAFAAYQESTPDQLAVFHARIAQAETSLRHAESLVAALQIHAGVDGVLAQVPVTVGEQLSAGQLVAKIVNPSNLKAELRVAEVESRYLQVGQTTKVDTRHGVVVGTVTRVEPEVVEGSVTIDVVFEDGTLPTEARPDLSVTGLVEVSRLSNVLCVARPAAALAAGSGKLYCCETTQSDQGPIATLNSVEYGIASANEIVIVSGLSEGDEVIISDLSRYDEVDELRLRNYEQSGT